MMPDEPVMRDEEYESDPYVDGHLESFEEQPIVENDEVFDDVEDEEDDEDE